MYLSISMIYLQDFMLTEICYLQITELEMTNTIKDSQEESNFLDAFSEHSLRSVLLVTLSGMTLGQLILMALLDTICLMSA